MSSKESSSNDLSLFCRRSNTVLLLFGLLLLFIRLINNNSYNINSNGIVIINSNNNNRTHQSLSILRNTNVAISGFSINNSSNYIINPLNYSSLTTNINNSINNSSNYIINSLNYSSLTTNINNIYFIHSAPVPRHGGTEVTLSKKLSVIHIVSNHSITNTNINSINSYNLEDAFSKKLPFLHNNFINHSGTSTSNNNNIQTAPVLFWFLNFS